MVQRESAGGGASVKLSVIGGAAATKKLMPHVKAIKQTRFIIIPWS